MPRLTREQCDGVVLEAFRQVYPEVHPITPETALSAFGFPEAEDTMDVAIDLTPVRNKLTELFRTKRMIAIFTPNQLQQKLVGPVRGLTVGSVQHAVWEAVRDIVVEDVDDF